MAVLLSKLFHQTLRQNTRRLGQSHVMSNQQGRRGAFIVFEGCDRAGKTTQCKELVQQLNAAGHTSKYMNFPDRSTHCGQMINGYLTRKDNFTDEGIHLMFTLNRWEKMKEMERLLQSGVNLIVDRYSFSGVAFSAAKGLDIEWCKAPEAGLLKPDLVILLTLSFEAIAKRGGFGDERYEVTEFQKKVMEKYLALKDNKYWKVIDADKDVELLSFDLFNIAIDTIQNSWNEPLSKLW